MRRVRLVIRGFVQGVSYRASAQDQARRLGLTGWVKNQPDGGVLLEAQGPADRVDALVTWSKDGPPHAQVEGVDVLEILVVTGERGFTIQR
jgi:acylphosphatase